MHRDGSDSARARSARIRSSHDDEATQLDAMRRRTQETPEPVDRIRLMTRLGRVVRRLRRTQTVLPVPTEIEASAGAGVGE
jgi:hypothetical protein